MTDLPTPETHSLIPATELQFAKFIQYERERFERDQRSTDRPPGGRLSIACPICRCKAVFDDWFKPPVAEGVGWRGHMAESFGRAVVLDGVEHDAQAMIEWSHGLSAWDAETAESDRPNLSDVTVSWKSNFTGKAPTRANYQQDEVMMVAAGRTPGAFVDTYILDLGSMQYTGPYRHVLTDEAHSKHARILEGTGAAIDYFHDLQHAAGDPTKSAEWDSPRFWHDLGLGEGCGGCLPHTKLDANGVIEKFAFRYEIADDRVREAEWDKAAMRYELLRAARLQLRAEIEAGKAGKIETYGGDGLSLCLAKAGTWQVRRKAKTADAVAYEEPVIAG